ncbi:MAG: ribosome maturation factor RimM, partial [Burkholderiales bacterium]|nr:ribosome maturation factor RimM [Burkholderiales bacterium]
MNTQPTPAELPDDAVEMGRISGAWGIKGWIKVHAFSAGSDALMAAR